MGLEFKINNLNLLDDIEAELSKKLNLKISFDDENSNDEKKDSVKKEEEN